MPAIALASEFSVQGSGLRAAEDRTPIRDCHVNAPVTFPGLLLRSLNSVTLIREPYNLLCTHIMVT